MTKGQYRIIKGRNAPITIKDKELTDFEVAYKITGGNKFEADLLLQQISSGKVFNGQYFTNKEKAKKEERRKKYFGDEEEDG